MKNKLKRWMRIPNFLKNMYIIYKIYSPGKSKYAIKNCVILFFENGYGKNHPGLMDRMRTIIGVYYIAKYNNMQFKLVFSAPFDLTKYLIPNKIDWIIKKEEISYKINDVHFFNYWKKEAYRIPKLKTKKQNHCYTYYGHNASFCKNEGWHEIWHDLYCELFKKSEYLEKILQDCRLPLEFIAVHFRFINILEKNEKGHETYMSKEEKENLINKCFLALEKIGGVRDKKIYVFSDSKIFILEALKRGYDAVMPDKKIGHISYCNDVEAYDKMFIDLYAMAESSKVYSVQGMGLYASVFSLYASIIGDCDYEIIDLEIIEDIS